MLTCILAVDFMWTLLGNIFPCNLLHVFRDLYLFSTLTHYTKTQQTQCCRGVSYSDQEKSLGEVLGVMNSEPTYFKGQGSVKNIQSLTTTNTLQWGLILGTSLVWWEQR